MPYVNVDWTSFLLFRDVRSVKFKFHKLKEGKRPLFISESGQSLMSSIRFIFRPIELIVRSLFSQ
jgi:hypothetical protein